jgi:hypothetical protein
MIKTSPDFRCHKPQSPDFRSQSIFHCKNRIEPIFAAINNDHTIWMKFGRSIFRCKNRNNHILGVINRNHLIWLKCRQCFSLFKPQSPDFRFHKPQWKKMHHISPIFSKNPFYLEYEPVFSLSPCNWGGHRGYCQSLSCYKKTAVTRSIFRRCKPQPSDFRA